MLGTILGRLIGGADRFLQRQPKGRVVLIALVSLLLVALLDHLTGYELSFSIFYLVPIALVAWHAYLRATLLISLASALCWLLVDITMHPYSQPWLPYWNALVRLGFFMIVGAALCRLRHALQRESGQARSDSLTGLANTRAFVEMSESEIARARRYGGAFTVAYIDVDNFKAVNDSFGHLAGDNLLREIADALRRATRATDVVGRMGGDEFAVLFPMTDAEGARAVVPKLHQDLRQMAADGDWPIGFSIGAVIWLRPPSTVQEMVKKADDLMYAAKQSGKNRVVFATVDQQSVAL